MNPVLNNTSFSELDTPAVVAVASTSHAGTRDEDSLFLASLVQASEDPIVSVDCQGIITSWNPAAEKLFGWAAHDAIGEHVFLIVPSERHSEFEVFKKQLAEGRSFHRCETQRLCRDGKSLDVSLTVSLLRDTTGKQNGFLGIYRDITDTKRAEKQARENAKALTTSEKKYHTLVDSIPQMVWTTCAEGKCDYLNQQGVTKLGISIEDVFGWKWLELLHPEDIERTRETWQRAVTSISPYNCEYRVRQANGEYRWFLAQGLPLINGEGQVERWVGSWTDIHDRKIDEDTKTQLVSDLRERVKELTALHAASKLLQQDNRSLSELLREFACLLPPALCFPELAAARVSFDRCEGITLGFMETPRNQSVEFTTSDGRTGAIELVYVEEMASTGPVEFSEEETLLLDSLAELLLGHLERRLAKEKLAQDAMLLASVRDSVIVTDLEGKVTYWNEGATRLFGWTAEEMLGQLLVSRYPDSWISQVEKSMQAIAEGDDWTGELKGIHKDGSTLWIDTRVMQLNGPDGRPVGIMGIAHDISDRKQVELALRESDERFRLALANSSVTVCNQDKDLRYTWIYNPHPALSSDDLTGKTEFDLFEAEEAHNLVSLKQQVLLTGNRNSQEAKLTIQGQPYYYQVTVEPLHDDAGEIIGVTCVCVNITDRKRATDLVQRLNDSYRVLHSSLTLLTRNLAVEDLDEETALQEITEQVARTLQVERVGIWRFNDERDAIVSADVYELSHARHTAGTVLLREQYPTYFRAIGQSEVLATGDARHDERTSEFAEEYFNPTGIVAMLDVPIQLHGRLEGIICLEHVGEPRIWTPVEQSFAISIANLISLFLAQWDFRRAKETLQLRDRAIQAATQGVLITDPHLPDNPIIYVSPGFEKITGYSAEEVLGQSCRMLQGEDTAPESLREIQQAIEEQRPCTVELLNYRKDGTTFWNSISISPVTDAEGKLVNFIGVQTDVTEKRKLEDRCRQSQKMEAIGQLAGGIAHDFNNMLTIISGYTEMLLDSCQTGDASRDSLEEIRKASERSAALTRQLLTFSRKQVISPYVLNLNDVVQSAEKMLRYVIGEDILFETVLAHDLNEVKTDPGEMEQILVNLAVNARDAMPQGGTLSISTSNVTLHRESEHVDIGARSGDYVLLSISDTGTGMEDEVKQRVFEPFFTTKEQGHGTGLGLAAVHGVIEQSNGFIEVESELGKGTLFKIYLPAVKE